MSFVVTSSQTQTKHLPLPGYAGLRGDLRETFARHAADRFDARRQLGRHEDAERVVVLDARAGLCEERVGGLATSGGDEEVAGVALTVEDEAPDAALAALSCELARTCSRRSTTFATSIPTSLSSSAIASVSSSAAEDDGALAGLDREVADEAAHAVGEHHADEVVPREDERLLGGAGGDDDPLGAEPVENGAGVDGNEAALPDPERAAPARGPRLPRARITERGRPRRRARRRGRPSQPRERQHGPPAPPPDDEHARPAVLRVVAPRVPGMRVELPEPGRAAQELLVQRPRGARADERAVVEADRGERAADLVGQGHEVEVERPADVLPLDDRALADRLGADADVRNAVDGHLAVRAVTRAAEEPARPVVLERAREDTLPGRERRGRDACRLRTR